MRTPACYATGKAATTCQAHSSIWTKIKLKKTSIIMKTSLLYHLKQISWQSMLNEVLGLESSLLKYQGWNISKSTNNTKIQFFGKNEMKFKNLSPGNHENPFALSFKANFLTIQA